MAKRRPPLLGYNHNVRHAGQLFHVQTEDSGPSRPHVTTHVFLQGTILSTSRSTYDPEAPDDVVLRLMQTQHKAALRRLRDGAFDDAAPAPERQQTEPQAPVLLPEQAAGPAPERPLVKLDAPGAVVATTAPYNPVMSSFENPTPHPEGAATLSDAELAELVDLATGSLDAVGPTVGEPAEAERVLELEAEPPSEDEVEELRHQAQPSPPSQQTPSQLALYASSRSSPRRIAVLAPTGGYMARQRYSSPPAPPAPPAEPPPLADLQPEPTRIRLSPSGRGPGGARPQGRAVRTTARRLDPSPFRPRPTAEGVVVQRPLIVTEHGVVGEERPTTASTDPKVPAVADERSLDQVILAYLAEDPRKKQ